ncbi:MAG TPA: hypothetical protein VK459_23420 [Polyangiaceae bacterium]|nr:hypothetical protein [Polyangiaceae bacterium]
MTRAGSRKKVEPRGASVGLPLPGILGESVIGERRAPVIGLQWRGML